MRRPIMACALVAIVVTVAQPVGAIDDGFHGRYRIIARRVSGVCPNDSYRHQVNVRYVNGKVRQFGHPLSDSARRFRYGNRMRPRGFPWRHTRGNRFVLRYDMFTDSAHGFRHGLQGCKWRVHLVSIEMRPDLWSGRPDHEGSMRRLEP